MNIKTVDVIIPTYRPDQIFEELLRRISSQTYAISNIIVMNTEESFWDKKWEEKYPLLKVHHLKKEEFDHGRTRKTAAELSDSDIMIFMTQDAMPANAKLVERLVEALDAEETIGAAYARQLPAKDCKFIERYTRGFNYPEKSSVKYKKDLETYGIKTYFCSNVCAAYKKEVYQKVGGFVSKTIFNEDMIYAGNMVKAGYGVAYAADAQVIHSHNYSAMQQLHRNFDMGVSQAEHLEIFKGVPSEGEGIRLVKRTMVYLLKSGKPYLIPQLIIHSGFKYLGYLLGKKYEKLPGWAIQKLTMSPNYWK